MTNSDPSVTTSPNTQADATSKADISALLNPAPSTQIPSTTTTAITSSTTAAPVAADPAGSASETPATVSTPDVASSSTTTNTTNGTGYTPIDTTSGVPLSKNQQKKARREAAWAEKKALRKAGRKEENRKKRERKRELRGPRDPEAWKDVQRSYIPPTQLPITLLLDCAFDDKMKDGERVSLAGQITRSYSENKNSRFRTHLAVSSFEGKLRERFDGILNKNYTHWKHTHFLDEDFTVAVEQAKTWMADETRGGELKGVFEKYAESEESAVKAKEEGEVIYLSSDSDYTLTELKPYSTYIIGGLVDKNREKGICHKRAVEKGVKTARLPIGDYLDMASRKVLATNHVVEIMLQWLTLGDWGEAFMKVIPMRKGAKLKGGNDGSHDGEGEDGGEDEDEDEQGEKDDDDENEETAPGDEGVTPAADGGKTTSETVDAVMEEAKAEAVGAQTMSEDGAVKPAEVA